MPASDAPNKSFLQSTVMAASNSSPEQSDPFWVHEEIDAARWNQNFPYQLLVVKRGPDGRYYQDSGPDSDAGGKWVFTLPFPPSALSVSMPFAINGSVMQGGYLEEHGKAPVRMITLSGTLGVLPLRGTSDSRQEQNLGQAIFAGTLQQFQRVATSANSALGDLTGGSASAPNLVPDSAFTSPDSDQTGVAKTSGYYQLLLLEKFFEDYVAFKATSKGRDYRLALAIWKRKAVYLVTPITFNSDVTAESPLEPTYNLVFRAYRRVKLDGAGATAANQYTPAALKPNVLQRAMKSILDARDTLENLRDVLAVVGGDLDRTLFQPLRQAGMFLKDLVNAPLAFSDLPVTVLGSCQQAIIQYVATQQAFNAASETFGARDQAVADAYSELADYAAAMGVAETKAGQMMVQSASQVADGGFSPPTTDAALDVFRRPEENYAFFASLQPSQMNLPPVATRAILNERLSVRQTTRLDFETMRDQVMGVLADFSDAVGAGSSSYDATYQRSPAPAVRSTPTPSDWQAIFALNQAAMELNRLAASGTIERQTSLKGVDFVAGLARGAGLAFTTPRSKYAVPFQYGHTLEQLAALYLGDPDRWIEIAALNGLRAPYVDETGFDLPLLTNGDGNQLVVADGSNLYVGQQVWVASATASRTIRHVTRLDVVGSETVVTVDGDATMGNYKVANGAVLHAYLPDTVNSQQMIYIPSDQDPATEDYEMKAIPGLDVYDQLLAVGGVDLLLTPQNDLVVTPDGDTPLAVGMTNIVQEARIRLSVRQGTLPRHPTFGLPLEAGMSVADLDAKALLKAAQNLFADDPTFTGVSSASVLINGPTAALSISVGIRGRSNLIPLTFTLPA